MKRTTKNGNFYIEMTDIERRNLKAWQKQAFGHEGGMNVFPEKGDKVICDSITVGYQNDQELAAKYLEIGKVYTVETGVALSSVAYVWLQEFPGIKFSNVSFIDLVDEAGEKSEEVRFDERIVNDYMECLYNHSCANANIPQQITYHDIQVDWYEAMKAYGEIIKQPSLNEDIQKEIKAKCDTCEKADCHPDCSAGKCPYYLIQDYLVLNHPVLFGEMKPWAEARLRQAYPDPNEQ